MLYVNPSENMRGLSGGPESTSRRKQALEELERLFLFELLREMRRSVPKSELFGQNRQQDLFEEMLDDHVAGVMAKSGQLGLGKQMERQMRESTTTPRQPVQWLDGLPLAAPLLPLPLHEDGHGGIPVSRAPSALKLESYRPAFIPLTAGAGQALASTADK